MVKRFLILLITILYTSLLILTPLYANSVDELENKLEDKSAQVKEKENLLNQVKKEIENIANSSATLSQKLVLIDKELDLVNKYVADTKQLINRKEGEVKKKEEVVNNYKKQLNSISSDLYKSSRIGVIDYFFLNSTSEKTFENLFYKQYLLSKYIEDFKFKRQEFAQINDEKLKIEKEKKDLEAQLASLDKIKASVIAQKNEYKSLIATKSGESKNLSSQIGILKEEISDLQVAILLAKSGATTSIGNVPSSGDFDATLQGFTQKAPSGYFGVFSFGAYTHRMGMSQYGAQARAALSNQKYDTILKAYYGKTPVKRGTSGNISVAGYGQKNFETEYLYGIAEMPSSWHIEALKAQAVAARTYAYNYYFEGKTICITQSCQVWNPEKAKNPPASWKRAVDETKGMIVSGVVTYYSATSGGYLTTSGWDTTDKKGGTNGWTTNAWESKANSPWFYKAWYRQSYSDTSASCSRKPWMSPAEMADILNTYLVVKNIDVKGSVDSSRLLPVTLNQCKISGASGNPYSVSQMAGLLNNPVTSITGNPVENNDGKGNTTSIQFITNRGVITISGADFKQVFNLRAPGYLSIPQNNYVFIDIVRK